MITYNSEYRLCYAHRVWGPTQTYDATCRMIHGHTADLGIFINYDIDAVHHRYVEAAIADIHDFLAMNVFNRFIIDSADPMFYTLVASMYEGLAEEFGVDMYTTTHKFFLPVLIPGSNMEAGRRVNLQPFEKARNSPIYDVLSGYFITDFCPSSPLLAEWLYKIVASRVTTPASIDRVEWCSSPNRNVVFKK